MPSDSTANFYCHSCGGRVTTKSFRPPTCSKCGLLMQEGVPPKVGKLGLVLVLSGLLLVVCVDMYFIF